MLLGISDPNSNTGEVSAIETHNDLIASWKEIAAYFKRDIRTVQLWEKRENFPVHRRQSMVFAFRTQIDNWRSQRAPLGASSAPLANAPVDRLESWKEIAAHFGRDVRTVQLWEKNGALPVHRQHHRKQSSVYAFKSQLDAWRPKRPVLVKIASSADRSGRS